MRLRPPINCFRLFLPPLFFVQAKNSMHWETNYLVPHMPHHAPRRCPIPAPNLARNYHASYTPCLAAAWYTYMSSYLCFKGKFCLKKKKSMHIKLLFKSSCLKVMYNKGQSISNSFFIPFVIIQVSVASGLVRFQSVYSSYNDVSFPASSHYWFLSSPAYAALFGRFYTGWSSV